MKTIRRSLFAFACIIHFSAAIGQSLSQNQTNENPGYPLKSTDDTLRIIEQPQNDTTCLGGNGIFEVIAKSPGNMSYSWLHNNNWISGGWSSNLIIENVGFADTGTYFCILAGSIYNDTVYTDTVRLLLKDVPFIQAIPEGPTSVIYTGEPEIYQVKHHESVTSYTWTLFPGIAGETDSTLIDDRNVSVIFNRDFTGIAGLFVEMRQGSCRTRNSDTLWISVVGIPSSQEICIVGVDQETEKCRVVWNNIHHPVIAHYNIYRESNEAGVFLKLASVPADDPGIFVDSTSVPYIHPHSYKISLTDTNGNESVQGKVHTTMLLSSSIGTSGKHNLSWTHYVGHPFLTYEIHHGLSSETMTYLTSLASTVNSFIVQDPIASLVYYQIVASREGCNPVLKSETNYGETRSNINEVAVHIDENMTHPNLLQISPNPASSRIRINYLGEYEGSPKILIINMTGKVFGSFILDNNQTEIDVSDFPPGIYLVKLKTEDSALIRKLVIRH